jgi:cardiolipin synthase
LFFLRQWEFCSKKKEDYSSFLNLYTPVNNDCVVIPYADGLDYLQAVGRGVYERIISGAKEFLYIMTPYFVIDDGLSELLINQALSGVDVRIILPDIPDKTYVYGVSRNNAEKLVDYGVKVYTLSGAFVHSKVIMSENCASVGSVNMDLRSFYQQFECGVYSNDSYFLSQVKSDFDDSFVKSKLITENDRRRNNIFNRIKAGAMQVFAPFM